MDDFTSLEADQNFTTLEQWSEIQGNLIRLKICQPYLIVTLKKISRCRIEFTDDIFKILNNHANKNISILRTDVSYKIRENIHETK